MGKEQYIQEFAVFIPFVKSLRELEVSKWNSPIAEGKWSVRDIVSHIMLSDKYFLEHCFEKIESGAPLTHENTNYDEFNQQAIMYAQGVSQDKLINEAIHFRNLILEHLEHIPEAEYNHVYTSGAYPFTVYEYVAEWFIPHDKHHLKQIQTYLNAE